MQVVVSAVECGFGIVSRKKESCEWDYFLAPDKSEVVGGGTCLVIKNNLASRRGGVKERKT